MRFFCLSLAFIAASACTRAPEAPAPGAPLTAGQKPFHFELRAVDELEIAKVDPATGEPWTARLKRLQVDPPLWQITSATGGALHGAQPLDRSANGGYVNHLLDTLLTLSVSERVPGGSPESFGLKPPRVALRWAGQELRLGNPASSSAQDGGTGFYAQAIGANAQASDPAPIYVVRGAALKMLEYLGSFAELRQRTWLAPLAADDVDQIELKFQGKPAFFAQREGDVWTDRRHKPLKSSDQVGNLLQRLVHARILEFVDDATLAEPVRAKLEKAPLYEVILTERGGNATRALVLRREKDAFGFNASRAPAVFRLFPETLSDFDRMRSLR